MIFRRPATPAGPVVEIIAHALDPIAGRGVVHGVIVFIDLITDIAGPDAAKPRAQQPHAAEQRRRRGRLIAAAEAGLPDMVCTTAAAFSAVSKRPMATAARAERFESPEWFRHPSRRTFERGARPR